MISHACRSRSSLMLAGVILYGLGGFLWAGDIAELHRKWVRPKVSDPAPQMGRFEALQSPTHGVSEIGLERAICFGACPRSTPLPNT
jgi:hypothetical protein